MLMFVLKTVFFLEKVDEIELRFTSFFLNFFKKKCKKLIFRSEPPLIAKLEFEIQIN